MNDSEMAAFEAELRKLRPAAPPESLSRRLREAPVTAAQAAPQRAHNLPGTPVVRAVTAWFRWLVPATAVTLAVLILWVSQRGPTPREEAPPQDPAARLRADNISVEQELVSSFDAIAELPGGEPVRFEFQEWMDHVVVRDTARGLLIQKRVPRVEIIPIRFETY